MIGELPRSVFVRETEYQIRTDFRDVLKIIAAFSDPELEEQEKVYVCLRILYEDMDDIPPEDYEEAFSAALDFIDMGETEADEKKHSRVMDWEQDESLIFPAVNKVAGFETRSVDYLHWWTFMGYFMEISDGVFSHVISLRMKKKKGKALEKWEKEYWQANKGICVLKQRISAAEQAERDRINAMLG